MAGPSAFGADPPCPSPRLPAASCRHQITFIWNITGRKTRSEMHVIRWAEQGQFAGAPGAASGVIPVPLPVACFDSVSSF